MISLKSIAHTQVQNDIKDFTCNTLLYVHEFTILYTMQGSLSTYIYSLYLSDKDAASVCTLRMINTCWTTTTTTKKYQQPLSSIKSFELVHYFFFPFQPYFYVALRPRRRDDLLGTGTAIAPTRHLIFSGQGFFTGVSKSDNQE